VGVTLLYSRLQVGHIMDGDKFEFNDILSLYKKKIMSETVSRPIILLSIFYNIIVNKVIYNIPTTYLHGTMFKIFNP